MRILPLLYITQSAEDILERYRFVKEISAITHAHERSFLACFYYLEFATHLLKAASVDLEQAYKETNDSFNQLTGLLDISFQLSREIQQIAERED